MRLLIKPGLRTGPQRGVAIGGGRKNSPHGRRAPVLIVIPGLLEGDVGAGVTDEEKRDQKSRAAATAAPPTTSTSRATNSLASQPLSAAASATPP